MHKVIVERPRLGSRGPYRLGPEQKNAAIDDLPSKQGVRRRYLQGGLRGLNENLGPLRRYLRKNVGRPWNKVYSEISKHLRPSSAVQQHVRDHIWDYVEQHATLGADGAIYGAPSVRWRGSRKLRPGDMYVHPDTGLLTSVKVRPKAKAAKKKKRLPRYPGTRVAR